jgi:autotransporter translocation and assembly factor TamB
VIDHSGSYTVTTSDTVTANSLTIGDGHATLKGSGTLAIPTIDNDGTIDTIKDDTLTIAGDVTGTGRLQIENKAPRTAMRSSSSGTATASPFPA